MLLSVWAYIADVLVGLFGSPDVKSIGSYVNLSLVFLIHFLIFELWKKNSSVNTMPINNDLNE